MHIINTAFKKAWPKSLNDSVLLGDWCIRGSSFDNQEARKLKVIDYHFNDRIKFNIYSKEINKIYDHLLTVICSSANQLFQKQQNLRYWEIIWGCWLYTFIWVIYDRNQSIEKVLDKYPDSYTNILDKKSYLISTSTVNYLDNIQTDLFNLQIFSSLWSIYKGNIDLKINVEAKTVKPHNLKPNIFKRYFNKIKINFFKFLFKNSNIIIFSTGFTRKLLFKIILKSKFKVVPFELFISQNLKKNVELTRDSVLRNKFNEILINNKQEGNSFLNLCLTMISDQAPLSLLEGYTSTVLINSQNITTRKNNYLFTANGFINDQWNILCAENVSKQAKIINSQHGGGYGIQLFSGFENHEIKVADKYVTMGWGSPSNYNFIPMPSPILNKNKKSILSSNGSILYIKNDYPRYLYRLFSHPSGKYVDMYRKWSENFLDKINTNLASNMLIRLYPIDQKGINNDFIKKYSKFKFDDYSESFDYQLKNCKIAISDTNQTTYLQSIALDIPTLVFWNPISTEIRPEAQLFINKLKDVGILHYSPESAASFLNLHYFNIDKWWMSSEVREARELFISNFANVNNHWENNWINFICGIDKIEY